MTDFEPFDPSVPIPPPTLSDGERDARAVRRLLLRRDGGISREPPLPYDLARDVQALRDATVWIEWIEGQGDFLPWFKMNEGLADPDDAFNVEVWREIDNLTAVLAGPHSGPVPTVPFVGSDPVAQAFALGILTPYLFSPETAGRYD